MLLQLFLDNVIRDVSPRTLQLNSQEELETLVEAYPKAKLLNETGELALKPPGLTLLQENIDKVVGTLHL